MKDYDLAKLMMLGGALLLRLGAHSPEAYGAAGDVDLSFDLGSGVNGTVHAMALQADGKIIIGGSLVRRFHADGNLDTTFNTGTGPNSEVRTVALQSEQALQTNANRISVTIPATVGNRYFRLRSQ